MGSIQANVVNLFGGPQNVDLTGPTWEEVLDAYQDYLSKRMRNKEPRVYRNGARDYLTHAGEALTERAHSLPRVCIESYLSAFNSSPANVNKRYWMLRSFSDYLVRIGYQDRCPVESFDPPKLTKYKPKPLDFKDWGGIVERLYGDDAIPFELRCGVLLIADTGCRANEIIQIRTSDIQVTEDGYRLTVERKGGRKEDVDVSPDCHSYRLLQQQLWVRQGQVRLFTKTYEWFRSNVQEYFPGLRLHRLRHTMGTALVNAPEGSLNLAQDLLGHVSINTTTGYAQTFDETKRAALKKSREWLHERAGLS